MDENVKNLKEQEDIDYDSIVEKIRNVQFFFEKVKRE